MILKEEESQYNTLISYTIVQCNADSVIYPSTATHDVLEHYLYEGDKTSLPKILYSKCWHENHWYTILYDQFFGNCLKKCDLL